MSNPPPPPLAHPLDPQHAVATPRDTAPVSEDLSVPLSAPHHARDSGKSNKRVQVKNACTNCKSACKKCETQRPCTRCVSRNLAGSCQDSFRKPRVGGTRGPYKRKPLKPVVVYELVVVGGKVMRRAVVKRVEDVESGELKSNQRQGREGGILGEVNGVGDSGATVAAQSGSGAWSGYMPPIGGSRTTVMDTDNSSLASGHSTDTETSVSAKTSVSTRFGAESALSILSEVALDGARGEECFRDGGVGGFVSPLRVEGRVSAGKEAVKVVVGLVQQQEVTPSQTPDRVESGRRW
ncbi:hypothetical protein HDU98_008525 [Podochytrium sp. JEL0797]|nr:hypothetical protein HDU98_008525 [Podochytrium sp. JEL0797]